MDLNGDIQFSRKVSDRLLLFPTRVVTDADFGDAVALDKVRYDQFGRSLQNQKILTERLEFLFELYQRLTQKRSRCAPIPVRLHHGFGLGMRNRHNNDLRRMTGERRIVIEP